MRARRRAPTLALGAVAAAIAAAAPPAASAGPPHVKQLVVQKSGTARQATVEARKTQVKVGGRSCTVPSETALAALAVSGQPKLHLHDYGSCSNRAQDAGGLFVRGIGGDENKGVDGWVYKVGNRLATAGAADPSGPFGNGRLRDGARVTWFYCQLNTAKHSCQRTLAVNVQARAGHTVHVHVTRYDDRGHGKPAAGATVHAGAAAKKADANGDADLVVGPGHRVVYAEKSGLIRSFAKGVDVS
jgi:hypothetical protein